VNDKVERMWKKVVMTYFKVLFLHFHGGTEENCKKRNPQVTGPLAKILTQDFLNMK
jgi:hypothetical protein